jgi:hypothetical protein
MQDRQINRKRVERHSHHPSPHADGNPVRRELPDDLAGMIVMGEGFGRLKQHLGVPK